MFPASTQPPPASIADLKEIPDPAPVSWMPQATGWWVLLAIVLLGLAWFAVRRWLRWRRNRYRREAQTELTSLEQALHDPAQRAKALVAVPALVKRAVLAWAPREQVAPMTGEAWLAYLDRTYPGGQFTRGPGRQLETLAYGDGRIGNDDLTALLSLLHRWIDDHVPA
ncbi:DUF4381 domain-containing protein [Dyella sp. C9]|uniref:DUF4381 domain-containing protein n=1 Tax=Dyella sp. C9 TaxID=2202154 RepID=UPI000DEFAA2B|nr:DUF4381 domain-containing protein [Dyella sp. C9]